MADAPLQLNVVQELRWDPRVDSESIAVSADDDGVVTLRVETTVTRPFHAAA